MKQFVACLVVVVLGILAISYLPHCQRPQTWVIRAMMNDSAHTLLTQECDSWQNNEAGLQFTYSVKTDSLRFYTTSIPASRLMWVNALRLNATKAVKAEVKK